MTECPICGKKNSVGATHCRVCGAPLGVVPIPSVALTSGSKLANGKYVIEEVLGQGGFGITYKGIDTRLARHVAIKEFFPEGCHRTGVTVHPGRIATSDFTQMKRKFLEEARVLAQITHPGVVRVYDFFEENNTAYIIMEFLKGKTLSEIAHEAGGKLNEKDAVFYVEQVCDALREVHNAGYLHRDIKPDNIIVCENGRVVLIDFGTARQYSTNKTQSQTVTLTPGFAPFEQYSQRAKRGPFTDIYALGATLYFLLTGEVPVDAPARQSGVILPDVRSRRPDVSEHVANAVMQALEMDPLKRPQTVDQFMDMVAGRSSVAASLSQAQTSPYQIKAPSPLYCVSISEEILLRGEKFSIIISIIPAIFLSRVFFLQLLHFPSWLLLILTILGGVVIYRRPIFSNYLTMVRRLFRAALAKDPRSCALLGMIFIPVILISIFSAGSALFTVVLFHNITLLCNKIYFKQFVEKYLTTYGQSEAHKRKAFMYTLIPSFILTFMMLVGGLATFG